MADEDGLAALSLRQELDIERFIDFASVVPPSTAEWVRTLHRSLASRLSHYQNWSEQSQVPKLHHGTISEQAGVRHYTVHGSCMELVPSMGHL